jgi:hypothetical protein
MVSRPPAAAFGLKEMSPASGTAGVYSSPGAAATIDLKGRGRAGAIEMNAPSPEMVAASEPYATRSIHRRRDKEGIPPTSWLSPWLLRGSGYASHVPGFPQPENVNGGRLR